MRLMHIKGIPTEGYGESYIDFQLVPTTTNPFYQATFVVGNKHLCKVTFKDLSQLQQFAGLCKEGIKILPPRFSSKWARSKALVEAIL